MGAIGGLLGSAGGANGTGFSGPQSAPGLVNPVTADQISGAYTGTQNSMQSQQQLLQALQGQNGLANQTQNYNQLQGVINGTGPNPAQAQLAQSTGANVANQAALMAGQRGAGANVGLESRQIAQQGANTQQQAIGQAATLQAQQSLNALGQAGTIANTQAGNQIGQTNANTSAQQAEQASLLGAQGAFNNATVSNQAGINAANAGLAGTAMQGQQQVVGGIGQGIGGLAGFASGGDVTDFSSPGVAVTTSGPAGPASKFGQFLKASTNPAPSAAPVTKPGYNPQASALTNGVSSLISAMGKKKSPAPIDTPVDNSTMSGGAGDSPAPANPLMPDPTIQMAAEGGEVDAQVSPGEIYLTPEQVKRVKAGENPLKVGEKIPGKPKVGGAVNSYANDIVSKKLKTGGMVIPRSETQSAEPARNSKNFVDKQLAKKKAKR